MRGYLHLVGQVNFRTLNWRSSKNVCAAPAACLSNWGITSLDYTEQCIRQVASADIKPESQR